MNEKATEKAERNLEIFKRVIFGEPIKGVADSAGLSAERVRQIVFKEARKINSGLLSMCDRSIVKLRENKEGFFPIGTDDRRY